MKELAKAVCISPVHSNRLLLQRPKFPSAKGKKKEGKLKLEITTSGKGIVPSIIGISREQDKISPLALRSFLTPFVRSRFFLSLFSVFLF